MARSRWPVVSCRLRVVSGWWRRGGSLNCELSDLCDGQDLECRVEGAVGIRTRGWRDIWDSTWVAEEDGHKTHLDGGNGVSLGGQKYECDGSEEMRLLLESGVRRPKMCGLVEEG